jgi:AraC family transcriptional regulator
MVTKLLPAGQHYGTVLTKWSSSNVTVCRIQYAGGSRYGRHGNELASIVYVETGHSTKRFERETVELPRGSMLLIPAAHLQLISFPSNTRFLASEISQSFLSSLREDGVVIEDHFLLPKANGRDFHARLLRELSSPDDLSGLVFEGILVDLFVQACRKRKLHHRAPPQWLLKARDMLHDRAFESLRLGDIAIAVEIHPAHLSRDFKRFFGVAPGEYLRRLRLDIAANQLGETSLPIADIAAATGFADQAHLARLFRRHKGMSPSEFRAIVGS